MKIKAELLPLEDKYYGTRIDLTVLDGAGDEEWGTCITLWDSTIHDPSPREFEGFGFTREDWTNNKEIPIKMAEDRLYYGKETLPAQECYEICDSHFESKQTYDIAMKIIEKLNGIEV